jgi:hypothetical protein
VAIVHVVMKSSSTAPPAAAHAQYIEREGQYLQRGGVDLAESGNMPEFAQADPHRFWVAADTYERKNGRAYTELQIALPRELSPEDRNQLARDATRELLGDRFAYTLAVHTPMAKDNFDQPHMHLMFSERAIDEKTRALSEEQFFKRNGAKKDPAWNDREKPFEVREKWVEMMNAAMQRAGHEQRLDPRSWAEQGREDLAALIEPKLLAGNEAEARALHAQVDQLREQRAELPHLYLPGAEAIEKLEQQAEQEIAKVQAREAQELSRLDKLIAAARELATEVKERTVAVAQNVAERVEQLRDRFERWREQRSENAEQKPEMQPGSRAQESQEQQRAGPELVLDPAIEQGRQAFRERYAAYQQAKEPAVVPEPTVQQVSQEATLAKQPEQELHIKHDRGFGRGL